MPKKISEMGAHRDIRIPLDISNKFFEKLGIDPNNKYLMDVKKSIFKFFNIEEEPVMTILNARKTLSEQKPNNAYGIPITDKEIKIFMNRFGLSEEDKFMVISKRIIQSVLST